MNKQFKKLCALAVVAALGTAGVTAFTACNPHDEGKPSGNSYTYEAEDAVMVGDTLNTKYQGVTFDRAKDDPTGVASDFSGREAEFVQGFGGVSIDEEYNLLFQEGQLIWYVNSDKSTDATLTLHAASTSADFVDIANQDYSVKQMKDLDMKNTDTGLTLLNNGQSVVWGEDSVIQGLNFASPVPFLQSEWVYFILDTATASIHLDEGLNKIVFDAKVLTAKNPTGINVDKIVIDTDATLTKGEAPAESEKPEPKPETPVVEANTFEAEAAKFGDGTVATIATGATYNKNTGSMDGANATWLENFGGFNQDMSAKSGEIIWEITSDKEADVQLTLYAASTDVQYDSSYNATGVNSVKLAEKTDFILKVGETVIPWGDAELSGISLDTPVNIMSATMLYRNFDAVVVTIHLTVGKNIISLATGYTGINVDKIVIDTDANLTFTATEHN